MNDKNSGFVEFYTTKSSKQKKNRKAKTEIDQQIKVNTHKTQKERMVAGSKGHRTPCI